MLTLKVAYDGIGLGPDFDRTSEWTLGLGRVSRLQALHPNLRCLFISGYTPPLPFHRSTVVHSAPPVRFGHIAPKRLRCGHIQPTRRQRESESAACRLVPSSWALFLG
jgi:hypothetical protein